MDFPRRCTAARSGQALAGLDSVAGVDSLTRSE